MYNIVVSLPIGHLVSIKLLCVVNPCTLDIFMYMVLTIILETVCYIIDIVIVSKNKIKICLQKM